MNLKRYFITSAAIFVTALAWNGVIHAVVLKEADSAISTLVRPDMADKMGLSIAATAGIAFLFVLNHIKWARTGTMRESILHGLFFAALLGIVVDVNQYALYTRSPGDVMVFLSGAMEFSLYAVISNKLYPAGTRP